MTTEMKESIRVDEAEMAVEEIDEPRDGAAPVVELKPADTLERLRRGETIRDARVVGLRFKGKFPMPVRMERVELVHPNFGGAEFEDEVAFERCKLIRPTMGHGAKFARNLDFRGSFIAKGHFANMTIGGCWKCDSVKAVGPFVVIKGRFAKVRFWDARFCGWADFKECVFAGEADFRSFHAEEGFKLIDCHFGGDALFRGSTSCKKWDAGASRFDGLLDLSKVKFHDFAYLEEIEVGPDHRLAFQNALAERILIRPDQVQGRLASEQAGEHRKAMEEYGLLKKVFEGLHRYEEEDWAFYHFQVNRRRSRPRSWRRPWTRLSQAFEWLFLDLGCGYGTNPFRAVMASAAIMLAFAVVYMLDVTALPVEKVPFRAVAETHPLNRVMIGVLTSVSVFTSGFGSLRDAAEGWMNVPLIVESLLGTLLWGLFIVAFSRKVIR